MGRLNGADGAETDADRAEGEQRQQFSRTDDENNRTWTDRNNKRTNKDEQDIQERTRNKKYKTWNFTSNISWYPDGQYYGQQETLEDGRYSFYIFLDLYNQVLL